MLGYLQRVLNAYAPIEPGHQRRSVNSRLCTPLGDIESNSIMGDESATSLVICLFMYGGPSAIVRRVVSVVIDPIQRCVFWPIAHIGMERREVKPTITHTNTTSAPTNKLAVFGIVTTLYHRFPARVFTAFAHAVRSIDALGAFWLEATTRARTPRRETIMADVFARPARAYATPEQSAVYSSMAFRYGEPPELPIREVIKHKSIIPQPLYMGVYGWVVI